MFQLVQSIYWIALSAWLGGVIYVAMAAPVIFRTVRDADPTLPKVLSVNMEGQHATLLAGTIVGDLLSMVLRVELICAGVVLLGLIAQCFFIDLRGDALVPAIVRFAAYLAAATLVIYQWRVTWPRIQKFRQEYIDHADEPDVANPAKEEFDRYQHETERVLLIRVFLLLGLIFFSSNLHAIATTFHFHQ